MTASSQETINYKVINTTEYEKILNTSVSIKSYQDKNTLAHIELLENGIVLLWPAVGVEGLWIRNKEVLDELLNTKIPLKTNSVFADEKLQKNIHAMNISFFISEIGKALNIDIVSIEVTDSCLLKIERAIKKYGLKKFTENFYIHFGYLLGEMVKKEYLLEWDISKQYGANPYYIPNLKTKKGLIITPYYKLNEYLRNEGKFKLKNILEGLFWFCKADGAEKVSKVH